MHISDILKESLADLPDAFMDLKAELKDGVSPDVALQSIASDYNLNADFLKRKFEEQFKIEIHNWVSHDIDRNSTNDKMAIKIDDSKLTKAKEVLDSRITRFNNPATIKTDPKYGKEFIFEDTKYLFLVLAYRGSTGKVPYIWAVKIDNATVWKFKGTKALNGILDQLK